jgi:feruloyl esterase
MANPPSPCPPCPAIALITARLEQRTGAGGEPYYIGMERVPAAWNGRFLYQGGGGMDGMIVPALGSPINTGTTSPLPLAQGCRGLDRQWPSGQEFR